MDRCSSAPPSASRLLALWSSNADAWARAVRSASIESRRLATDQAVIDAVMQCRPARVLDVGCGEGWLSRALGHRGIATRGIEAIAQLVEQARTLGAGDYAVATIADMLQSPLAHGFDLWVCNFSVFHQADAPALLAAARRHLPPGAALVIQTLHASATPGGGAQADGWQPGGWGACGSGFADPIPWYFRSLASWQALFADHGFVGVEVLEPAHPATHRPLSWLFTARVAAAACRGPGDHATQSGHAQHGRIAAR